MVKKLDENGFPPVVDHIGWRLWKAATQWKDAFDREMIRAGYAWFGDARSQVIRHLDAKGTRQGLLASRMQTSKQAVQQLIDQLVADGIVERLPDPEDKRGNIVVYTPAGKDMLRESNRVKKKIERDYRLKLGETHFKALESALQKLEE